MEPISKNRLANVEAKLDEIHKYIVGDLTTPGLNNRVIALEKADRDRRSWGRMINISFLGLVMTRLWELLTAKH